MSVIPVSLHWRNRDHQGSVVANLAQFVQWEMGLISKTKNKGSEFDGELGGLSGKKERKGCCNYNLKTKIK